MTTFQFNFGMSKHVLSNCLCVCARARANVFFLIDIWEFLFIFYFYNKCDLFKEKEWGHEIKLSKRDQLITNAYLGFRRKLNGLVRVTTLEVQTRL